MTRTRALGIVLLVAISRHVWAEEPPAPVAQAAHVLALRGALASTQRELAQVRMLLEFYQRAMHALVTEPHDKALAEVRTARETFEQAHPAPSGFAWDWTTQPPSYKAKATQ